MLIWFPINGFWNRLELLQNRWAQIWILVWALNWWVLNWWVSMEMGSGFRLQFDYRFQAFSFSFSSGMVYLVWDFLGFVVCATVGVSFDMGFASNRSDVVAYMFIGLMVVGWIKGGFCCSINGGLLLVILAMWVSMRERKREEVRGI